MSTRFPLDPEVLFPIQMGALILYVALWIPARVWLRDRIRMGAFWGLWITLGVMPLLVSLPTLLQEVRSSGAFAPGPRINMLFLTMWAYGCLRMWPRRRSGGSAKPSEGPPGA